MKKITFSADESGINLAQELARSKKTTPSRLFGAWVREMAGRQTRLQEYCTLMARLRYANPGRKFTREEMNERR